jgi:hypothetical protein
MIGRLFRLTYYLLVSLFLTWAGTKGGLGLTNALVIAWGITILIALQGEGHWAELFPPDEDDED